MTKRCFKPCKGIACCIKNTFDTTFAFVGGVRRHNKTAYEENTTIIKLKIRQRIGNKSHDCIKNVVFMAILTATFRFDLSISFALRIISTYKSMESIA
jgi:hypothetical protein